MANQLHDIRAITNQSFLKSCMVLTADVMKATGRQAFCFFVFGMTASWRSSQAAAVSAPASSSRTSIAGQTCNVGHLACTDIMEHRHQ